MSLCEKQLPYKHVIVSLFDCEMYEPWYMKINSKGQVPVLQDGDDYIPDSGRIAEYLDNTYGEMLVKDKSFGLLSLHYNYVIMVAL